MLILNALSLNMLPADAPEGRLVWTRLSLQEAQKMIGYTDRRDRLSAVGHADTAALFSELLQATVPCERRTVVFGQPGTYEALVGQYSGPRLSEGTTSLPGGARVEWFRVDYKPGPEPVNVDVVRREVAREWLDREDTAMKQLEELRAEVRRRVEQDRNAAQCLEEGGQSLSEWLSRREGQ